MENIKLLLDKHESLKSKGLRLTDSDIHNWIWILDTMIDMFIELDSECDELEEQLKNAMDNETILLKNEWWTDMTIKAKVKDKFYNDKIMLIQLQKKRNIVRYKQESVNHYINLAKRVVK